MADGRSVDLPRFHAPLAFEARWDTGPGTILVKSVNRNSAEIKYPEHIQQPQNRADDNNPNKNSLDGGFHRDILNNEVKEKTNYDQDDGYVKH